MAQLKSTVVQGSLRVTDTTYTTDLVVSGSKTAKYVLAAPNAAAGAPTWRALANSDVGLGNVENTKLSTWAGTTNITTLGTIVTGTWNATAIGATKGGTGQTTYTIGDILYSSAANTLSKLGGNTTTTRKFLRSVATTAGTAVAPAWDTVTKTDVGLSNVTNDAQVKASLGTAKGDMLYWSASATPARLAIGTAGYTLQATANGPAWTQTVAVANGGTGKTSWTQWGVLYASASTTLANTAAGTAGYLLQSNASSAPSWIQATNSNTASTIVKRDSSGNFSAGTITALLTANRTTTGNYITLQSNSTEVGSLSLSTLGPANTEGWVSLTLGNNKAKSTANNASGKILLYHSDGAASTISAGFDSVATTTKAVKIDTGLSVTGDIESTGGFFYARQGNIWAGTTASTTAERDVGARAGSGNIYLYAQAATTGNRGICGTNAAGTNVSLLYADQSNWLIMPRGITAYTPTAGVGMTQESGAAIQIREVNGVGNTQTDWSYAPKIGFHWANTAACELGLHSDGVMYLCKQNTSTEYATFAAGNLLAVSPGATTETQIVTWSGAGRIYLYSAAATTGNRGIFTYNAAGTGTEVITLDQNNLVSGIASFAQNTAIQKAGASVSWIDGRTTAIIKTTSYSGYTGVVSMKTTDGDWSLGVYSNNAAYLTYITDANYTNRSNAITGQVYFEPTGTIVSTGGGLTVATGTAGVGYAQTTGSAIQIREVALVGTGSADWTYAPKIGFHWSGRAALQLGMNSGQELCLLTNSSTTVYGTFRAGAIVAHGVSYAIDGFVVANTYTQVISNHYVTQYWDVHYTSSQVQFHFHSAGTGGTANNRVAYLTSGGVFTNSSKKVKTNITPLQSMGNIIDKLQPVEFTYTYDPKHHRNYGLIYEDTTDLLPYICDRDDPMDDRPGINYAALSPVLLKEIQDLRKRVKTLEEQLSKN